MTLVEFERRVFAVALASPVCGVPILRRLTPTSINLRLDVTVGGFVDIVYNERSGATSYTLIRAHRRAFGVDNTGGWHRHPASDPDRHETLPAALSFAEFVAEIERHVLPE